LSERDLVTRLLARGGDPDRVTVGELMTPAPATIRSDERVIDALKRMREGGFRHLPIVDDGELRGMVSVRDLFDAVREELEEGLRSCEALVYGDQYALSQH
jgi:CBS domain-containing protein